MTTKTGRKCSRRGCKAYAVHGSALCFAHDPGRKAERLAERSRGGKSCRSPKVLPDSSFSLQTIPDVKNMLGVVTNAVLVGKVDVNRAKAAMYGASIIITCIKDYDLEKRMDELEKKFAAMGK